MYERFHPGLDQHLHLHRGIVDHLDIFHRTGMKAGKANIITLYQTLCAFKSGIQYIGFPEQVPVPADHVQGEDQEGKSSHDK
jgi:hypothetical protein